MGSPGSGDPGRGGPGSSHGSVNPSAGVKLGDAQPRSSPAPSGGIQGRAGMVPAVPVQSASASMQGPAATSLGTERAPQGDNLGGSRVQPGTTSLPPSSTLKGPMPGGYSKGQAPNSLLMHLPQAGPSGGGGTGGNHAGGNSSSGTYWICRPSISLGFC